MLTEVPALRDGAARLGPEQRERALSGLDGEFDILVVGGGVTGAGTALDAATRGLRTLLVEAQDWAAGTSSRSSKLVHGGLRYLQMLDFHLVREGLAERSLLAGRIAPHLVHPLPILYPLHSPLLERAYAGAGLALYDLMAGGFTASARAGPGRLPRHRHLARAGAARVAPGLRPLAGALLYYDAQVDDARLVVELVRTAAGYGAVTANRLSLQKIDFPNGTPVATLRDTETGSVHQARAQVAVLATGPWTEETEALAGVDRGTRVRPSKGVHIVVARDRIECSTGLIMRTDKSVLFVLPWGDNWVIGTTDTDWPYDKDRPLATATDVDYLLAQLNGHLREPLSRDDVVAVYAGLRPLVAGTGVVRERRTTRLSREHSVERPGPGLVVVSGGKYTTYRVMARDAVDAAVTAGGLEAPPSRTATTPLLGARTGAPPEAGEHLAGRYGCVAQDLLEMISDDPTMGTPVGGGYVAAEIRYAVTHEGARHLEDVMARRCRMAMEMPDGGLACARQVAGIMAPALGWDGNAIEAEVASYAREVRLVSQAASDAGDDAQAQAIAHHG
ncbi:MAG TPA: glycerol-3-phosphate dehydrogenase/oxidase [Acidimicrobiales bacterium]|nr:glycerol-3-phosphate dehydrogenase/oxidase [Acidimicrobiales bacterium]